MRKLIRNISVALSMTMVIGTLAGCAGKKMQVSYPYAASEYIAIGEYKGLTVEVNGGSAADEAALQNVIEQVKKEYMDYVPVEREAAEGDLVSLSFDATIGGIKIDGFSSKDYQMVIGKDKFIIDGFGEKLIGLKAGDERAITGLKVPDPFVTEPSYSGKAITFNVNIASVSEAKMPEYNDEFVTRITGGQVKTVEEYNERLMKQLKDNATTNKEAAKKNALYEQIVQNTQIIKDFPEDYVQERIAELQKSVDIGRVLYSMEEKDYVKMNFGVDTVEQAAKDQILLEMIFQAIIEKEKLTVTEQYYKDHLQETAKKRNYTSVDKFVKDTTEEGVVKCMLLDKADKIIVESAIEK